MSLEVTEWACEIIMEVGATEYALAPTVSAFVLCSFDTAKTHSLSLQILCHRLSFSFKDNDSCIFICSVRVFHVFFLFIIIFCLITLFNMQKLDLKLLFCLCWYFIAISYDSKWWVLLNSCPQCVKLLFLTSCLSIFRMGKKWIRFVCLSSGFVIDLSYFWVSKKHSGEILDRITFKPTRDLKPKGEASVTSKEGLGPNVRSTGYQRDKPHMVCPNSPSRLRPKGLSLQVERARGLKLSSRSTMEAKAWARVEP